MAIDTNIIDIFDQPNLSFEIRLYIEDSGNEDRDPEYVDFTNRLAYKGKDLLKRLGSITQSAEGKSGTASFTCSINNIEVDNSDGFWNKPIERGPGGLIRRNYPTILTTVNGNVAYFTLTKNYTQNVWHKHKVKLVIFAMGNNGMVYEDDLIVAVINDITRSDNRDRASISLWSMSMPLKKLDVSTVRDGLSWWNNKPISFLVRKLLEKEYGTIPDNFVLPDLISIPTSKRLDRRYGEVRVLSQYGRPPEYNLESEVWENLGLTCRAIEKWQWNEEGPNGDITSGKVLIESNNATEIKCEMGVKSGASGLLPQAGDVLTILQDDTYGNTGSYTIRSITEGSAVGLDIVELETPLTGLANDNNKLPFVINRIYMGCDNQLWEYLPDKDVYNKIADVFTDDSFYIRRLWYNPNDNCMWGAGWQDPSNYGYVDTDDNIIPDSRKDIRLKIFYYNGSSTTITNTIDDVFIGDFLYRDHRSYISSPHNRWRCILGNFDDVSGSASAYTAENIVLPFRQAIVPCNVAGSDKDVEDDGKIGGVGYEFGPEPHQWNEGGWGQIGVNELSAHYKPHTIHGCAALQSDAPVKIHWLWNDTEYTTPRQDSVDLPADYYEVENSYNEVTPNAPGQSESEPESIWCRTTLGQEGFCVFNKNGGSVDSNGVIWIFKLIYDDNHVDGMLKLYTIGLTSPYTVTQQTGTITGSGNLVNKDDGTGETHIYYDEDTNGWEYSDMQSIQPLCGCPPPNDEEGCIFGYISWSGVDTDPNPGGSPTPTGVTGIVRYQVDGTKITLYETPHISSNASFFTPLSVTPVYSNGTVYIVVSGFIRSKLGTDKAYALVRLVYASSTSGLLGVYRTRPPMRLVGNHETRLKDVDSSNATEIVYFVEGGSGALCTYNVTDYSISVKDYGAPIVDGEVYCGSNIIVDKITRTRDENDDSADDRKIYFNETVWGVSSSTPMQEAMVEPPSGKFYLWKFDCYMSGRIELANFEGMNAWEGLSKLAQISDHVMGFDGDVFYFIPKEFTGPTQFDFVNDSESQRNISITVRENRSEIYNKVEIVPYTVSLKPPTYKMELVTRYGDTPNIDITLDQRDNRRKTIQMVCVLGGRISQGNTNSVYQGGISTGIVWKYVIYDRIIETSLKAALTAPEATDTTTLTINEGLLDIGTSDTLEVYTVHSGMQTKAVYFVTRPPTDAEIVAGTVQINNGDGITGGYNEALSTAGTYQPASYPINSLVKIIKIRDWSDVSDNTDLFIVSTHDIYYEIGNTNIYIKFKDENALTVDETEFFSGDLLTIEAPGLVAEKNESARQIAVNMLSVDQYRKNPFPSIENRFINYKIARELCEKILSEYAWPKYDIELRTRIYPFIKFISDGKYLSLFSIVSPFLFPLSQGNRRKGYLKRITHNLLAGESEFTFRDADHY